MSFEDGILEKNLDVETSLTDNADYVRVVKADETSALILVSNLAGDTIGDMLASDYASATPETVKQSDAIVDNASDVVYKIEVLGALPGSPDANTIYYITA